MGAIVVYDGLVLELWSQFCPVCCVSSYPQTSASVFGGHQNSSFYVKSSISPDDQFLISGSSDQNAYIWKVSSRHPCGCSAHNVSPTFAVCRREADAGGGEEALRHPWRVPTARCAPRTQLSRLRAKSWAKAELTSCLYLPSLLLFISRCST